MINANTLENLSCEIIDDGFLSAKGVDYFGDSSVKFHNFIAPVFEDVLDYYDDYIHSAKRLREIFRKIKTVKYINRGANTWDDWNCNEHLFVINGKPFEYKTGTGINCQPTGKMYDYVKLLFDAVICVIYESNMAQNYSEDDFLVEFGYEESVSSYKRGIKAYAEMQENAKKVIAIFGAQTIDDIYDIIEL